MHLAITMDERAAPSKHIPSVFRRPHCDESETISGQHTIWAMEKALVAKPTTAGVAPIAVICNGKVLKAIPSEIIKAKTESSIGMTVGGSLSSWFVSIAAADNDVRVCFVGGI